MNEGAPLEILPQAISAYDYPPVVYGFAEQREVRFSAMQDLEDYVGYLLHSSNPRNVQDGLCSILYWGHYRRPAVRDYRVRRFRTRVTKDQLEKSIEVFKVLNGTSLRKLQSVALPEFRYMAFVTKLRTFLDPEHYCILDRKIAGLAPLTARLTVQPTYIPITAHNERAYAWWVKACQSIALRLHPGPYRPVDIERGLFYLTDHGRRDLAEQCLGSVAASTQNPIDYDDAVGLPFDL